MSFLINPYSFSTAGINIPADAASLLYFNGSNGSTTFTDELGIVWTAQGNAQISTTNPKEGSGCLLLDGSGDYIKCANHAGLDFGNGDFCVEGFVRWASISNAGIFHLHPSDPPPNTTTGLALGYDGANAQLYYNGGPTSMAFTPSTGVYYHFAVYRVGTTVRVAFAGNIIGSVTASSNISTNRCFLGLYYSASYTINGRIDAFLITKGSSPYGASNFTPPTLPY